MNVELDPNLNTNQITPELIEYIVQKIVNRFDPYQIILSGSQARGDAAPNSDLDLFIVQSGSGSNRQLRREIGLALAGRRFGLDLIVRKPQDVELNVQDRNPFYTHHILKGKTLYDRFAK